MLGSCVEVPIFATDSIRGLSLPEALLFGTASILTLSWFILSIRMYTYISRVKKNTGFIIGNLHKATTNSHNKCIDFDVLASVLNLWKGALEHLLQSNKLLMIAKKQWLNSSLFINWQPQQTAYM